MKKMFLAMICFTAIVSTVVAQDKVKFDPVNEEPEVAVPAGCACACARVIVPTPNPNPLDDPIIDGPTNDDPKKVVNDPHGGGSVPSEIHVGPFMSDPNSAGQAGGQRPVWRLFRRR